MTMLLGGAKLLKDVERELKGTVKLIFQPAEEGGAGGKRIAQEGESRQTCSLMKHLWLQHPAQKHDSFVPHLTDVGFLSV